MTRRLLFCMVFLLGACASFDAAQNDALQDGGTDALDSATSTDAPTKSDREVDAVESGEGGADSPLDTVVGDGTIGTVDSDGATTPADAG